MLETGNIMTKSVITVNRETTIQEVANLLVSHNISAVPVLDSGRLVGMVSEDGLLHRAEIDTQQSPRPWWRAIFSNNDSVAKQYVLAHGTHAGDVMDERVPTVSVHTPLSELADLFEGNAKKWFPVVDNEKVVGIVSRRDLIRTLANTGRIPFAIVRRDDIDICEDIIEALRREPWALASTSHVDVKDGVAIFTGTFRSEAERKATVVLAENVKGVRRVDDRRVFMDLSFAAY